MSAAIWNRLVWKELRHQLPMAALLVVLAWALVAVVFALGENDWERMTGTGYALYAIMAVATTALGGMLYATEREWRTDQQLRALPLTGIQLLIGKTSASLITALTLILVLSVAANYCVADATVASQISARLLVLGVEFFAWSWLLSLVTDRSLVAMMGGLVIGTVLGSFWKAFEWPAATAFVLVKPGFFDELIRCWPRWLVAAGLLVVASARAVAWLRSAPNDRTSAQSLTGLLRTWWWRPLAPAIGRPLGSLIWSTVRTSIGLWLIVIVLTLSIGALTISFRIINVDNATWSQSVLNWLTCFLVAPGLLAGVFVFMTDHHHRGFEFLSQRAVSSSSYWLARVVPWFIVAAICHGLASLILVAMALMFSQQVTALFTNVLQNSIDGDLPPLAEGIIMSDKWIIQSYLLGWFLLLWNGFGVSVFASSCIRHSAFAGACALLLAPVAAFWTLGVAWSGIPWWWGSFIVGASFLLGSWVMVRFRLRSPVRLKHRLIACLVPLATCIVVVLAAAYYRSTELPKVEVPLTLIESDGKLDFSKLKNLLDSMEQKLRSASLKCTLSEEMKTLSSGRPLGDDSNQQANQQVRREFFLEQQHQIDALRSLDKELQHMIDLCGCVHPFWLIEHAVDRSADPRPRSHVHAVERYLMHWWIYQMVEGNLDEALQATKMIWRLRRADAILSGHVSVVNEEANCPWGLLSDYLDHPRHNLETYHLAKWEIYQEFNRTVSLWSYDHAKCVRELMTRMKTPAATKTSNVFTLLVGALCRWLPHERERARDWLNLYATYTLYLDLRNISVLRIPDHADMREKIATLFRPLPTNTFDWLAYGSSTTYPVNQVVESKSISTINQICFDEHAYFALRDNQLALLIKLSVLEFHCQHGRYPQSLYEIDFHQSQWLRERGFDSADNIGYFPDGMDWEWHLPEVLTKKNPDLAWRKQPFVAALDPRSPIRMGLLRIQQGWSWALGPGHFLEVSPLEFSLPRAFLLPYRKN